MANISSLFQDFKKIHDPFIKQAAATNPAALNQQALKPPTQAPAPVSNPAPQPNQDRKFFQGNLINKAFDVLRAPEYAISSFWKGAFDQKNQSLSSGNRNNVFSDLLAGAKNVLPGVYNRTNTFGGDGQFFDYGKNVVGGLGVKNEGIQNASNIAAGFLMPTLPLGKVASLIGKGTKLLPGADKVIQGLNAGKSAVSTFARETPVITKAVEKVNPYFRIPDVGKTIKATQETVDTRLSVLNRSLVSLSKNLNPNEQTIVGQILEGTAKKAPKNLVNIANQVRPLITNVGQEAVGLKLLKPETFAKGNYMAHIWQAAADQDKLARTSGFGAGIVPKVIGNFFKKRTGAEGYVQQFAPAVWKGVGSQIKDVEATKLFKNLAGQYGQKIVKGVIPEGFVRASEVGIQGGKYGRAFRNLAIPNAVADYLKRTTEVKSPTILDKVMGYWKAGKTVWNPGYHGRNLISNQILSHSSTGDVGTVPKYLRSVANYFGKGNQNFVKAAEDTNLIRKGTFTNRLNTFFDSAGLGAPQGKLRSVLNKVGSAPGRFQQGMEDTSKLNVFQSWVQKLAKNAGKTVQEALSDPAILKAAKDKAEEAIFSPYRISQTERGFTRNVIPFYSFTRQAAPFIAKTAVKNPGRLTIYPKAENAVEGLSRGQGVPYNQKPDYMKGMIRLPIKDGNGRDVYFDPTYVYPWGNMGESFGKGRLPFGLSINPFVSEASQQLGNYDPYFQQSIGKSAIPSKNRAERVTHALRSLGPTAPFTLTDKLLPAFQGRPDYVGRNRSRIQSLLDASGLKTANYDSADLRDKAQKAVLKEINNIRNEERNVIQDQSMTQQEKDDYLNQLRSVYEQLNP